MVRLLLEMKVGLDTVMDEAFAKDERFGHALKDAFEHFVNQRANRYSQAFIPFRYILYCHAHMLGPWS